VVVVAPPVQLELAKPSSPSEMLQTLTGALIGALTVLPLPLPPAGSPTKAAGAGAADAAGVSEAVVFAVRKSRISRAARQYPI
jgi:hypothetical protein